jgi:hypothetical protein
VSYIRSVHAGPQKEMETSSGHVEDDRRGGETTRKTDLEHTETRQRLKRHNRNQDANK